MKGRTKYKTMNKTEFASILPCYFGQKVFTNEGIETIKYLVPVTELDGGFKTRYGTELNGAITYRKIGSFKLILRKMDDMTEEEFKTFAKSIMVNPNEKMAFVSSKGDWSLGGYSADEFDDAYYENNDSAILYEMEQNDHESVLTYSKSSQSIQYGFDDEHRFFVPNSIQAKFINYLRSIGVDTDNILSSEFGIHQKEVKP